MLRPGADRHQDAGALRRLDLIEDFKEAVDAVERERVVVARQHDVVEGRVVHVGDLFLARAFKYLLEAQVHVCSSA